MPILRTFARAALGLVVGCLVVSGVALEVGQSRPHSTVAFIERISDSNLSNLKLLDVAIGIQVSAPINFAESIPDWTRDGLTLIMDVVPDQDDYGLITVPITNPAAPPGMYSASLSHNQEMIATFMRAADAVSVEIINFSTMTRRGATSLPNGGYPELIWSPDDQYLLIVFQTFGNPPQIYMLDVDILSVELLAEGGNASWSPDSSTIVYCSNSAIRILDISTHLDRTIVENTGCRASWSPDSDQLAYTSSYGDSLFVYHIASGQSTIQTPLEICDIRYVAWSPDGAHIAFVGRQRWDDGFCFEQAAFSLYITNSGGGDFRIARRGVEVSAGSDWYYSIIEGVRWWP